MRLFMSETWRKNEAKRATWLFFYQVPRVVSGISPYLKTAYQESDCSYKLELGNGVNRDMFNDKKPLNNLRTSFLIFLFFF